MAYSGYCPPTVTVYNWATIKVLIYLYFEYYPTVTEWGQYPRPIIDGYCIKAVPKLCVSLLGGSWDLVSKVISTLIGVLR